jgi:hypothetical protein
VSSIAGTGGNRCTLQARDLHAVELHARDLGEHLHEPVLDELEGHQRLAELLALACSR